MRCLLGACRGWTKAWVVVLLLAASIVVVPPVGAQDLLGLGGESEVPAEETERTLSTEVDAETDRAIAESLERRLGQNAELRDLEVTVDAGVVRLSGEALSPEAKASAGDIARRTESVASVTNDIQVVRDVRERLSPAVEKLRERLTEIVASLPLFAIAVLAVLLAAFVARQVSRWKRPYGRLAENRFVLDLAHQVTRAVIVGAGVLVGLEILDATAVVGAVLGAAGVLGLAIGFAFRDLIENYIAGVLLAVRQPFEPGDLVFIDGHEGKVMRLTSRATILMTLAGNHLRLPNSTVFKGIVLNYTRNPRRRFDFAVGVGTGEDLVEAQRLGAEELRRIDGVLADPHPWAQVEELGDSSVVVRFYGWVDQRETDFIRARSEALRRVKIALEEADMDLPEPIYRVFMVDRPTATPKPGAGRPSRARPDTAPAAPAQPGENLAPGPDPIDRQIAHEKATSPTTDLLEGGGKQE